MSARPIVQIIATGGTISSKLTGPGGYSPALGAEELLRGLSAVPSAAVRTEEFSHLLSYSLGYQHAAQLVLRLSELESDPDVCGTVVTHGTGAMEEMAYLCDLTFPGSKPVVFTGATYHASDPGSDGPHNLAAAIQVAADPQSRGRGVMICFAGEIHAARDAVKLQKYSPVAFTSPNGPLGLVDAAGLVYYRQAMGRIYLPFPSLPVPQVEVVKAVFDMDDLLLRSAIEARVAGIVVDGLPGSGGVPPSLLPSVALALDRRIPVVLTSRAPFGRITPISRGESGPRVLHEMGAIMAGDLPAPKARLLVAVAVGNRQNVDQLRETFHLVARGGHVPQN
jgi:L-asparaginase